MCARTLKMARKISDHPLVKAASQGNVEEVKKLITEKKFNVNAKDEWGETALHGACGSGHIKIVKSLLSVPEVDINIESNMHETPLATACRNNQGEIALFLLNQYNDKLHINTGSVPPLHSALFYHDFTLVDQLLDTKNIDVNHTMQFSGKTALAQLCIDSKHLPAINYLLEKSKEDIDVNKKDDQNQTPLYIACRLNAVDIIERLLQIDDIEIDELSRLVFQLSPQNRLDQRFNNLIKKLIPNCTSTKHSLDLSGFESDDYFINSLTDFIYNNPQQIHDINLGDCFIRPEHDKLLSILGRTSHLSIIRLSNNIIQDKGCRYLCQALKERKNPIFLLLLPNNSIGDEGCLYLSDIIRHNLINQLAISCENITERGFRYLSDAIKQTDALYHLETIYVENNDLLNGSEYFSKEALRQIQINEQLANNVEFRKDVHNLFV